MSTRSAIMLKFGGRYMGVFCHWDGYPHLQRGVGFHLQNTYNTEAKILYLLKHGAIESLRARIDPNPGEEHTFESQNDITVFYKRDGKVDEDWADTILGKSPSAVANQIEHRYSYLFKDGEWFVKSCARRFYQPLSEVMEKLKAGQDYIDILK